MVFPLDKSISTNAFLVTSFFLVIFPRVKDLKEETFVPFERQEIGRSDLGLDCSSSNSSCLHPALLHLLQPPAVATAAPAASFTKLLYPSDAFAAGLTSKGESTYIADPPTNMCCRSQKSVIRTRGWPLQSLTQTQSAKVSYNSISG